MPTDRVAAAFNKAHLTHLKFLYTNLCLFVPCFSRSTVTLLALHLNLNNHNNITFFLTPSVSPSQRLSPLSHRSGGNETD